MSGGVQDGQAVSAAVTDAAFLFKNADDVTAAKLGLNDQDPSLVSGAAITNVQREFNALWSWLGGLINQAKTYLPVWPTSHFGLSSDNVLARIAAIDAAYDPAGAPLASRAGQVSLGNGVTSVTVAFSTVWPDTAYVPMWNIENTADATPAALQGRITARTTGGFTVTFDSPTDSLNYKLNYFVRKAG
jgi:hypothetical protein